MPDLDLVVASLAWVRAVFQAEFVVVAVGVVVVVLLVAVVFVGVVGFEIVEVVELAQEVVRMLGAERVVVVTAVVEIVV